MHTSIHWKASYIYTPTDFFIFTYKWHGWLTKEFIRCTIVITMKSRFSLLFACIRTSLKNIQHLTCMHIFLPMLYANQCLQWCYREWSNILFLAPLYTTRILKLVYILPVLALQYPQCSALQEPNIKTYLWWLQSYLNTFFYDSLLACIITYLLLLSILEN